jgi:oxygen-independent coproporphyrinogen-3 oxidase
MRESHATGILWGIPKKPIAVTHLPLIDTDLLRRFDVSGPRYTSYPTAERFVDAFDGDALSVALAARQIAPAGAGGAMSLYVHLPFCESLCYYCACNKIITKHHNKADQYLDYLCKELDLVCAKLSPTPSISQLHLGGGSPTFLSDEQLRRLMKEINQRFRLMPGSEIAIEVDPRTINVQRLGALKEMGFNRLSFGVQDFDPGVQKSVNRVQPADQVFELVAQARAMDFESINVDLIYGLPKQNTVSFTETLRQVVVLSPDRIALYAYAHLPTRFKSQRRIDSQVLPSGTEKVAMLALSLQTLQDAGYVYIGMDHFAKPNDPLAVAKRQGRLHRNFQGYSTQPDCDLLACGVSSISKIGSVYAQNAKTLDEYYDLLDAGRLPTVRGLELSRDDIIRRGVIMALMCQGALQFEDINLAFLIDFKKYFAKEIEALGPLSDDGLLTINAQGLQVTALGWYFVRGIAMVFDRYTQTSLDRAKFSKIL